MWCSMRFVCETGWGTIKRHATLFTLLILLRVGWNVSFVDLGWLFFSHFEYVPTSFCQFSVRSTLRLEVWNIWKETQMRGHKEQMDAVTEGFASVLPIRVPIMLWSQFDWSIVVAVSPDPEILSKHGPFGCGELFREDFSTMRSRTKQYQWLAMQLFSASELEEMVCGSNTSGLLFALRIFSFWTGYLRMGILRKFWTSSSSAVNCRLKLTFPGTNKTDSMWSYWNRTRTIRADSMPVTITLYGLSLSGFAMGFSCNLKSKFW